jgi:hypothetical protein
VFMKPDSCQFDIARDLSGCRVRYRLGFVKI